MPPPDARVLSRRALTLAALGAVTAGVIEFSGEGEPADRSRASSVHAGRPSAGLKSSATVKSSAWIAPVTARDSMVEADSGTELPRGGRRLFPAYRLIGYSGGPGSAAFGRLGVGDLDARVLEIEQMGVRYAAGRDPMPVLELIAVVAQPRPGPDGRYRVRVGSDVVQTYLDAARRHQAILLLNIQPGQARFIDEVRALEPWLRQPDVGLALDPEWAVRRGQIPGRVFGRTTGVEIDAVAAYLSALVVALGLPEKALVVHQLAPQVVLGLAAVRARPGVIVIKSVDGIGPPGAKEDTWRVLMSGLPATVRPGFKLFFDEDTAGHGRLMTPAEVLALKPTPEYVLYE